MNKKPTKQVIAIFIVIMILVNACGIAPVVGSGNLVTDMRPVSGFDMIAVSGEGLVMSREVDESTSGGWDRIRRHRDRR